MARKLKDRVLDSKDARRRLKPRTKPYWRSVERGLHLGYRRHADKAGPWIARRYMGNQTYSEQAIGIADDYSDADGVTVLDYWQAVTAARGTGAKAAVTGPYTVADALQAYFEYLRDEKKSGYTIERRLTAHALPAFGKISVDALTTKMLKDWHRNLAKSPARVRTSRNGKQQYRELAADEESVRRRKASANRALSELSAALNMAFRDGKVSSDTEWKKVKPFYDVDASRIRHLTVAESKRLLNACEPDFRNLVRAALETGARYSELTRLKVEDFNPDVGTVAIRTTKTGKPRHVILSEEGAAFFQQLYAGRPGSETMLLRHDGKPWGVNHQLRPIVEACGRAGIERITFHGLRHTWASLAVMNGMALMVVARNLGHTSTAMTEKHYGHLAPSFVVDQVRQYAPRFDLPQGNVRTIR